jgi:hypothetical protein
MPEDTATSQDSLRQAINRILGFSPGASTAGTSESAGFGAGAAPVASTPRAEEAIQTAARTPFSNISGGVRQSGPVYDPFASVNAELAALKAKNDTLAAQLTKPAATPAAKSAVTGPTSVTTGPALSPEMQARANLQLAQTRALGASSLSQSMAGSGYQMGPTGAWQPVGTQQPLPMGSAEAARKQMMGGSPFLISGPSTGRVWSSTTR